MTKGTISIGEDTSYLTLVTGQTSITTAAIAIVSDNGKRGKLILANQSTDTNVFVSSETSLSTSNGLCLFSSSTVIYPYAGLLYGITASGTAIVSYGSLER